MKRIKLSTVFAIVGLVSYLLALYFMYRETCKYYEDNFDLNKDPDIKVDPEKEIKEKSQTDGKTD